MTGAGCRAEFRDYAAEASENVKTVVLGGVQTFYDSAADNLFFRLVEQQASALDGLASLVATQVPRNSTVIDIGADIGLSTIALARLVERVVVFEPSPPSLAFLRKNLELNEITNVEVIPAAVSSEMSIVKFHVAQSGAGSHVVAPGHIAGSTITTIDVPAVTLDQTDWPRIGFIRIGAKGHEPDVLAGAKRLLARDQPLIWMQVNLWCLSAFASHSPQALVSKLWEAFEASRPESDGQMTPISDSYSFLHDIVTCQGGSGNVVLRPRDNVQMPTLQELTWPEAALTALRRSTIGRLK